jgi:hypothetical protein
VNGLAECPLARGISGPGLRRGAPLGCERRGVSGRRHAILGVLCLLQFALVCVIKTRTGLAPEILWLSHVSLLLAGGGLLLPSARLLDLALVAIFSLHSVWLLDFACGFALGVFPLAVTRYLQGGDPATWVATIHHFYLMPVLCWNFLRRARTHAPRGSCLESWLAATAFYLWLSCTSRWLGPPALNVNFAYGVLTAIGHPFLAWANGLPAQPYLLGLNAFVSLVFFLPPACLASLLRSRSSRVPAIGVG